MNIKILITGVLLLAFNLQGVTSQRTLYPQLPQNVEEQTSLQGWKAEASLGFDFLSNVFINPKAGSGENRLSIGLNGSLITNYNFGRLSWSNQVQLAYGIQKTGNGYLNEYPPIKVPFKKNTDRLFFNSKMAYRTSYFSKFYYTSNVSFNSQLAKTYPENYIKAINETIDPLAQFLAPATLQIDAGIDYRHDLFLSIFFAPISFKSIIVNNDSIANSPVCDADQKIVGSVHGNLLWEESDSIFIKNIKNQVGAAFRLKYESAFWQDRIEWNTSLNMFLNYLHSTNKKIDVVWRNEVELKLFKMFSLAINSELSYDDDVFLLNGPPSKSNCERKPHAENSYKQRKP